MPVKRADTGRSKYCDELFLIKQPVTSQGPAPEERYAIERSVLRGEGISRRRGNYLYGETF